ncbi:breast carcinoma-amplified sequence 1 isoform X2 [Hyla sarda]|uniref:breast carcinoma-amplified sequence 1 isoform X2 n=1 Tax=Hyla sarda TaxID=327740 RepID=UPI0024C32CCC|nr:breast carcinoma-amplified sequence 1 isoform X2 [Hyla sarda]
MGNEVSNSEVEEEQEGPVKKSNPEFAVEAQNGSVILQSSPALSSAPETNYVSSKQVIQQENMITSSQKTIVFSPISNGSVTTPPPPAAKSKFRLTISRPSPGRTSFQPNGKGDVGPMKQEITLQESPVVQTQLMTPIGPDTVVVKENGGGIQNQAPPSVQLAEDEEPSTKPKEDEEPPAKPKEVSFFQKIFKPEKKPSVQNEVTINEPVVIDVDQTAALQSSPPSDDLQSQSVDDYDQATSAQEQSSASEDTQNTPPAELHPVMSFFKTLVTPNKSVTKSEEEVKTEGEDKKKENGGFRKKSSKKEKHKSSVQQTSETEAKNLKKSESPKSGTLSRLFKQKAKKDEQQTSGGKVVLEQSVVSVSVNSEKSPPDQVTILDPKTSDVPKQIIASEEEGKAAKESAVSRPKLFWRKSFKGEPQPNKVQENGVEEQATQPVSVNTTPEQIVVPDTKPPDSNAQPQENEKPVMEPSSRSVPFWRKSFKGDPQPRKNQDNVVVEQPVVSISVNSEKSSPEQALTPDTKPPDSDTQQPESEKPPKEAPTRPLPFWKKSFKADPPPQKVPENVVVEPPVVSVSVNSEKSSPEQVLTQDTKAPDSDTQQPESGRPQKEASARPLPFWRKSFKGDPQTLKAQENSSSEPEPQSSKSNTGDKGATPGSKSPENKKQEDAKATKPKIMMFFKQLSVLGDGSNISPEESTEKSSQEPTLDITDGVEVSKNEKTVVTAVVEPPPPPPLKGKDAMKEKKASAEKLNKQESRESAEAAVSVQLQAPDPVQVDDKASRDGQLKRTEKRQSLGNFFKTIGMKRMCDAEVQTDPVTILPAEKTK